MRLEHSRTLRLAARASCESESELARRLAQASVVVSLERTVPGAVETAATVLETLRRGPGRLYLDASTLTTELIAVLLAGAIAVAPDKSISLAGAPPDAVRIHVGSCAPAGTICGFPDGYGARIGTHGQALQQCRPPTALGVMLAAALLAGEAFKYLVPVRPQRCRLHAELAFCPVTLGSDLALAPDLSPDFAPDLGLIGLGAVGSAHARILGGLTNGRHGGRGLLVDPQTYAAENTGTYSLGGYADSERNTTKVDLAASALADWTLARLVGTAEEATALIDVGELKWPTTVLSGLDSIQARHAAQSLWPSRLIDAATGDTAVGLHDVASTGPCLRCMLPERSDAPSAATVLADALGLPIDVVMQGAHHLSQDDLSGLSVRERERLWPHLGTPICGLASAIGLTGDTSETYSPSVPFVSQQAACLSVGRLIATSVGLRGLPNFVQYDALIGPQAMTRQNRLPVSTCYCQQRARTIRAIRASRSEIGA